MYIISIPKRNFSSSFILITYLQQISVRHFIVSSKENNYIQNLILNPKTYTKDKTNPTLLALNDLQKLICH